MKKYVIPFFALLFFNTPCDANYDFSVIKGKESKFEANIDNASEFEWTFPGGTKRYGSTVFHTFDTVGEKEVLLKVTTDDNSVTAKKVIYVINDQKPTAIINVEINGKIFNSSIIYANTVDEKKIESLSVNENGTTDGLVSAWFLNNKSVSLEEIRQAIDTSGTYNIKLVVSQEDTPTLQDKSTISLIVKNTPPVINAISFEKDAKLDAKKVKVTVDAEDADDEIKQYRFEVLEDNKTKFAQVSEIPEAVFNLSQTPGEHEYKFKVEVSDTKNQKTKKISPESLFVENIVENTPPSVTAGVTPGNTGNTETVFYFVGSGTDADGDALKYEWTFSDGEKNRQKHK